MSRSKQTKSPKEYMKSSEFIDMLYQDIKDEIKEDMESTNEAKDYVRWIQNFSKKIVTITCILYVVINIFILFILYYQSKINNVEFNTLYSEINETFRIVIGGYLIKSGVENTFKIGGNYLSGVADSKLQILQDKIGLRQTNQREETTYDEFDSDSSRYDDTAG